MQDGDDTRQGVGLSGVQALDAGVRQRAAQGAHEELVGQAHVLRVLGAVGDDADAMQAGRGLADDAIGGRGGGCGLRVDRAGQGQPEFGRVAGHDGRGHLVMLGDEVMPTGVGGDHAPLGGSEGGGEGRLLHDA